VEFAAVREEAGDVKSAWHCDIGAQIFGLSIHLSNLLRHYPQIIAMIANSFHAILLGWAKGNLLAGVADESGRSGRRRDWYDNRLLSGPIWA
jgi:hypothetical protein